MAGSVLITGVNGFAGRHLARHLSGFGYDVVGLFHKADAGRSVPGVERVVSADICDLGQVRQALAEARPAHVIHLAGIAFVAHDDVTEVYRSNILGARNLLLALTEAETPPEAVMLVSSANVYGGTSERAIVETDPVNPLNDYAVSKVAMELMARQFADRLPIICLRPFNFTGLGQSENFVIPKIVSHFKSGVHDLDLGNLEVSRDFSDVRDVVEYIRRLMCERTAIGDTFNICSGRAYNLGFIVSECERLTSRTLNIRSSESLARKNEVRQLLGNPGKLHRAVGALAMRSMSETLAWMLDGADASGDA